MPAPQGRPPKTERNAKLVEALKTDATLAEIAKTFGISAPRVHALGWELAGEVMRERKAGDENKVRLALISRISRVLEAFPSNETQAKMPTFERLTFAYMDKAFRFILEAVANDNDLGLAGFFVAADAALDVFTADLGDESPIWLLDEVFVIVSKLPLKTHSMASIEAFDPGLDTAIANLSKIGVKHADPR